MPHSEVRGSLLALMTDSAFKTIIEFIEQGGYIFLIFFVIAFSCVKLIVELIRAYKDEGQFSLPKVLRDIIKDHFWISLAIVSFCFFYTFVKLLIILIGHCFEWCKNFLEKLFGDNEVLIQGK